MDYSIKHNSKTVKLTEEKGTVFLDGKEVDKDFKWIKKGELAFLTINNKSYKVIVNKQDLETKTFTLQVNNQTLTVNVTDSMDELLKDMGLDKAMNKGAGEIKSPMPGLVLKVNVKEGEQIQKGTPLLILEAMKMENVIKSTVDGTVKAIHVKEQQAIEKNKLMIEINV